MANYSLLQSSDTADDNGKVQVAGRSLSRSSRQEDRFSMQSLRGSQSFQAKGSLAFESERSVAFESERVSQSFQRASVSFDIPDDGGRHSFHLAARISSATKKLRHSEWYRSMAVCRLRSLLHGQFFSFMMVIALLIALFVPDLCIISGVSADLEVDMLLSMVMVLFFIELVFLSAVDATYFLSFFFVMDLLGTLSMTLDISYLLGTRASAVRSVGGSHAMDNMALLRSVRAARVGARAGRLSRILRLLRFLPSISGNAEKAQSGMLSVVISAQLSNCVAMRVAKLMIFLVMVVPLFDIMCFPQIDYSLQTWVERLSELHRKGKTEAFSSEMDGMVEFFRRQDYGPCKACHGYVSSQGSFVCERTVIGWSPNHAMPARLSSMVFVHSGNVLVSFNMHGPTQLESILAIAMTCFIIFSMVFSSFTLSLIVTELAVRPLEVMLRSVREIASTVFQFSEQIVIEHQEEDENYDVESTMEMELLERVVSKLAIIADLHANYGRKRSLMQTKDMHHEDLGVLSMLQGKNIIVEEAAMNFKKTSSAALRPRKRALTQTLAVKDIGISQDLYQSWAFNALHLAKSQKLALASITISRFHEDGEGFVRSREEESTLERFLEVVYFEYMPNPFHNFSHAVDVLHMVGRIMRLINSEAFLTDLEQFSLLVSAVSHDIGHLGVNNIFLSEVGHDLAMQYNDRSPLENMHCARLFSIVGNQDTNIFSKMTSKQFKECRKHCIGAILHTDMITHQAMVKDLQMTYQVNSEVFLPPTKAGRKRFSGNFPAEVEVFRKPEVKDIVMNTILHSADVSNPCRSWEVTQAWAFAVLDEYFAQGDQEKILGIPLQILNDREKLNKPNSQIGFIEFMIAPYYAAQIRLLPGLAELGDNLVVNTVGWEQMWIKEVNPAEDERQKLRFRVEKIRDSIEDAKMREMRGAPKEMSSRSTFSKLSSS